MKLLSMKKILGITFLISAITLVKAQDFQKNLATARASYVSGDLENARFAMQQMLNDIDVAVGKEIMKIYPDKMDRYAAIPGHDDVSVNTGLTGVIVRRDYGSEGDKVLTLETISNSPLVSSLNAFLSLPFVGNSGDGTQKSVKVDGYKGILQKNENPETNQTTYTLQIPIGTSLLTFTVPDSNESEVMKMANTIPVSQIAKMVQ